MEYPKKISKFFTENPNLVSVLMITITAVIVHGLAIPRLGYYHDDWYMLWSGAFRGNTSLISLFSTKHTDRSLYILYRLTISAS